MTQTQNRAPSAFRFADPQMTMLWITAKVRGCPFSLPTSVGAYGTESKRRRWRYSSATGSSRTTQGVGKVGLCIEQEVDGPAGASPVVS